MSTEQTLNITIKAEDKASSVLRKACPLTVMRGDAPTEFKVTRGRDLLALIEAANIKQAAKEARRMFNMQVVAL